MIIITDYTLVFKEDEIFWVEVESNSTLPPCPCCSGAMHYRDTRLRICKKEGGEKQWLQINRLRCAECHKLHNELPDCLTPYKHYETEVIAGVLDEVVSPDDTDSEDYPCVMTMQRWLSWFQWNLVNIEGHLRRAGYRILDFHHDFLLSGVSLLDSIRKDYPKWLETILRIIYNSGGFLESFCF